MAISLSTGLRNTLLDTANLETAFNDSRIIIYSGTVPADADAAVTGTILCIIGETSASYGSMTTLTFGTAASGAMQKSGNTWSGTILASGTATFWRMIDKDDYTTNIQTDGGKAADATKIRIQGTIGTAGADGNLSSTSLTSGGTQYIDYFSIGIPTS